MDHIKTMGIQRIAGLLSKAKDPDRVFPATDIYNEGWMLRLVIDWFSRNPHVDCDIQFLEGSRKIKGVGGT